MLRSVALSFALVLNAAATMACPTTTNPSPSSSTTPPLHGNVADPSGAVVPNAKIDLVEDSGKIDASFHSDGAGNFLLTAPHTGNYTLVVSEPGFDTIRKPIAIGPPLAAPLTIVLPIASATTHVEVSAGANEDMTAGESNADTSVMTSSDLKALPIFDNDYATAMSAFMDTGAGATAGTGLIVDGVEADHAAVSSSAVQEVRINQDPYSAQYYYPGRGQMEIITRSAADRYHGEFNFTFRDSALNAQNALAPSKPFEQRRVYEGHVTGPIPAIKNSSFLISFDRSEEDLDSVVSATVLPTAANPGGIFEANVPSPTRFTQYSIRAAHQFGDRHSAYAQYSWQEWDGTSQGVGGQTLAQAGSNGQWRDEDAIFHVDSTLSATLLNQLSLVLQNDSYRSTNDVEAPRISVSGDFTGGSAQGDSYSTEYNARMTDMVTWTQGKHLVKYGIGIPHLSRRALDDNGNALGSYTFGPTLAADGVTVLASALQNYADNLPSSYSENTGQVHFIYHLQEMGAFVQDQWKLTDRFAITPGLRYDWQNFLANDRLSFSPRLSMAYVLDDSSKTVLRGGGGIYYDRFGSGPLADLARYENAERRSIVLSFNPAALPASGCVPITLCATLAAQPPNLAVLAPNAKTPYQMQYGLSIERGFGDHATGTISVYSARGIHSFRSVDINAPTPESGYTERPNPAYGRIRQMQPAGFFEGSGLDIGYRGRLNKYFTGFGRYTWSHYESNNGGIAWFPQDQLNPNDEWSNASFDRRNRFGMYAIFNQESLANLAVGIFANSGAPWTILTGTDKYGDGLFNTRPDGVGRDSETNPDYVDLDMRWGHDFHLTADKSEESPKLGFSAGAFNLLNHENSSYIDPVETSPTFGQTTAVNPPRRIQVAMRFEF